MTDLSTFSYDPKLNKKLNFDSKMLLISSEQKFSFNFEYDFVVSLLIDSYLYIFLIFILIIVYCMLCIIYCLLYIMVDKPTIYPVLYVWDFLAVGTILNFPGMTMGKIETYPLMICTSLC